MKIAIILSRVPYPLQKGDKLRAFHQIKHLSKNHKIYLFALSTEAIHPDAAKALDPYCEEIHLFRIKRINIAYNLIWAFLMGLPLQVGYFHHFKSRRRISKLIVRLQPDHVYNQLLRTAEYSKHLDFPKTIDYQDVFSKGLSRRANNAKFIRKAFIRLEYRRVLKYEKRIFNWFDHHTIISDTDRQLMPLNKKNEIHIVSNGVDLDYFSPISKKKEYDIIFSGNMAYHPNVTAALYLIEQIFPLIKKKLPETKLVIAGANPVQALKQLESVDITITGWVDDLRDYYNKSKIFIAPMLTGTGLQNKLLEAMAMHIPCITTQLANRALGGQDEHSLLISNNAAEFADAAINLLENPMLRNEISNNAKQFVTTHFSWENSTDQLESIMGSEKSKD